MDYPATLREFKHAAMSARRLARQLTPLLNPAAPARLALAMVVLAAADLGAVTAEDQPDVAVRAAARAARVHVLEERQRVDVYGLGHARR